MISALAQAKKISCGTLLLHKKVGVQPCADEIAVASRDFFAK
jgi:hypothetical protein